MARNFRKINVRRYSSTVPNLTTLLATSLTPSEILSNYLSYANGQVLNSRTAIGSSVEIKSSAPRLLGAFPGGGMNTDGYSASRIGGAVDIPQQTPQLTVAGTILATPANLTFSPWGGTGTLDNAVNGKATRLLRPIFVKAV